VFVEVLAVCYHAVVLTTKLRAAAAAVAAGQTSSACQRSVMRDNHEVPFACHFKNNTGAGVHW